MASAPHPTTMTRPNTTGWTLFTNHAHVLLCIAKDPDVRLRDVALEVGITERAVQRIVSDLEQDEFIEIQKEGRRNRYIVNTEQHFRHQIEQHCTIEGLLKLVLKSKGKKSR